MEVTYTLNVSSELAEMIGKFAPVLQTLVGGIIGFVAARYSAHLALIKEARTYHATKLELLMEKVVAWDSHVDKVIHDFTPGSRSDDGLDLQELSHAHVLQSLYFPQLESAFFEWSRWQPIVLTTEMKLLRARAHDEPEEVSTQFEKERDSARSKSFAAKKALIDAAHAIAAKALPLR